MVKRRVQIGRIHEMLRYDAETGRFFWRVKTALRAAGDRAGFLDGNGHRRIGIDGKRYWAHHLVWFIETGKWPLMIDHINGQPDDNRIENLRVCTRLQNQRNVKRHRDNTSGFKGVFWIESQKRFHARITTDGKAEHLGSFVSAVDAARAYDAAAVALHGEFARLNGA